jgi:hypothetical protein
MSSSHGGLPTHGAPVSPGKLFLMASLSALVFWVASPLEDSTGASHSISTGVRKVGPPEPQSPRDQQPPPQPDVAPPAWPQRPTDRGASQPVLWDAPLPKDAAEAAAALLARNGGIADAPAWADDDDDEEWSEQDDDFLEIQRQQQEKRRRQQQEEDALRRKQEQAEKERQAQQQQQQQAAKQQAAAKPQQPQPQPQQPQQQPQQQQGGAGPKVLVELFGMSSGVETEVCQRTLAKAAERLQGIATVQAQ